MVPLSGYELLSFLTVLHCKVKLFVCDSRRASDAARRRRRGRTVRPRLGGARVILYCEPARNSLDRVIAIRGDIELLKFHTTNLILPLCCENSSFKGTICTMQFLLDIIVLPNRHAVDASDLICNILGFFS